MERSVLALRWCFRNVLFYPFEFIYINSRPVVLFFLGPLAEDTLFVVVWFKS